MDWQEAARNSPNNRAIRVEYKNGLTRKITRYKDGHGYIEVFGGGVLRLLQASELEGFLDWQPDV